MVGSGCPIDGQESLASSFTASVNFCVNAATEAGEDDALGLSATNSEAGPSPCNVLAVTQKV